MALPTTAWAVATSYLLGQLVSNGGSIYQCVQAGESAATGTGPAGSGANIVDNGCLWTFVDNLNVTEWDSSLANILTPSGGVTAAGFATGAQVPSTLLNYLFRKVDAFLLWLTNLLSYANTWTGKQTFAGGAAFPGGIDASGVLQLGRQTFLGNVQAYKAITQSGGPIAAVTTAPTSTGPNLVLPPQPPIGMLVVIKDESGAAGTHPISVSQPGSGAVPAWTVATVYAVGALVSNGGNTYEAMTTGTSAAAGTGPAGTGTDVVDGTNGLTWNFCPPIKVDGNPTASITTNYGSTRLYYAGQNAGTDEWYSC